MCPDGVFVPDPAAPDARPRFLELPPPTDEPADFGGWRDDDAVQPPPPDVLDSP